MPKIQIDFNETSYECGATLVSIFAYPEPRFEKNRASLHASLCHEYLTAKVASDSDWANAPHVLKPIHAIRDFRLLKKDLKKFELRLKNRMAAGKIAIAFLKELIQGNVFELPKGVQRVSLNELTPLVIHDVSDKDPKNIVERIWRPSLPVAHLASALAISLDQSERQGVPKTSIGDLLDNSEYLKEIIDLSNQHAEILLKSKRIKIDPDLLFRFYY